MNGAEGKMQDRHRDSYFQNNHVAASILTFSRYILATKDLWNNLYINSIAQVSEHLDLVGFPIDLSIRQRESAA